jgi:hypothetical protein
MDEILKIIIYEYNTTGDDFIKFKAITTFNFK